uniref:Bidirectional sugar transporter SWEET n=1 Tax=Ananas comosus var. bracteatus TaxID=296719 RepID=A0A6V7NZG0_ANACO|nr:unnamed protein product [Ananas comosus var. bracteatus]
MQEESGGGVLARPLPRDAPQLHALGVLRIPVVHPHSILVVTINGVGFVLESFYILIFLAFSPNRLRLKVLGILAVELLFMAGVITGVMVGAQTHEKRSLIVGVLCVIFGTCMYASPLSIMKLVIQTKSVKYMPFFLSLVGFLNGVCWTIYAFIRFDIFVTIPNGLGALLGLAQLILYLCYYRSTPCDENKPDAQPPAVTSVVAPSASNIPLATITVDK